jgi:uncharacterized membrane protein
VAQPPVPEVPFIHIPAAPPAPTPGPAGLQSLESKIGRQWIAWVGAVVVFLSAAFFLKHAFDNEWIGPAGQVTISAIVAVAILAAGSRFISKGWQTLGRSLVGLGLGILYATFFAAFSAYKPPVLPQGGAFAFMVAVTAAGMALAVLHNAMPIAFLAVLGGLLTPVMLSTGHDARDSLFTSLLLLDLGVLAVAFFRGWRLLDALAMTGTFALYSAWFNRFYTPAGLAPAMAWLGAFYLVFLALPFLYHLVRRQRFTIERFLMALANAAFAAGFAWTMLRQQYLFTMGFVALGMAAAYLLLGSIIRRRLPDDARALFGAIALTVTFLTLAVPLQLRAHGIMLAWVVEAPVLTYLAYRFRYAPARAFAAAVLVLAAGRLFLSGLHWPLHEGLYVPFFNRQWISAMAVPLAAAAFAFIHHRFRHQANSFDRAMKLTAALAAGLLALVIVHVELAGWLAHDLSRQAAGYAVAALWVAGAWVYLLAGAKAGRAAPWPWAVGAFALAVAAFLAMGAFGDDLGPTHLLLFNLRFAVGLLVTLTLLGYARLIGRTPGLPADQTRPFAFTFAGAGLVALLLLLSAEVSSFCWDVVADHARAERAGAMAVTLVWSVYAIALLVVGFWKLTRPLRLAGLALFGLAALKLVAIDLTFLRDVYRIVSFLVLGLFMLGASYLYHRLEKQWAPPPAPTAQPNDRPAAGESQ